MKSTLVLLALVSMSVASAFAKADSKLSCRSLDGAAKQVAVKAACKSDEDPCRASLVIDGQRGLIDMNQASNDMVVDLTLQPSQHNYILNADLTSDDATDVHVSVEVKPGSLNLAAGSTDDQGSAEFVGVVNGEIDRYNRKSKDSVTVASVASQELACTGIWSK